jgi:hypothetical protein
MEEMPDEKANKPAPSAASPQGRDKVVSGRTDDKVKAFDPALSPLGTDAEAASPHDEDGLRIAREASRRPSGPKA